MNKLKLATLIFITTVSLIACVDNEKNKLDNRVLNYWNAKITHDFKTAYGFLTPGMRKIESVQSYVMRMGTSKINWINAKIVNKKCSQPDLCEVSILIEYEYQFNVPGAGNNKIQVETPSNEKWILKDNMWYIML